MRRIVLVVSWVGLLALLVGCSQTPTNVDFSEIQEDMVIVELFNEQVARGWEIDAGSGLELDMAAVDFSLTGDVSLAVSNAGISQQLTFIPEISSTISYPNDQISAFRFGINGGYTSLAPSTIQIGFMGNEGGELVLPLASFTSPFPMPANEWQIVTVSVDTLTAALPDDFLTAIFLETDSNRTFFLDNIQLVVNANKTTPTILDVAQPDDTSLLVSFSDAMNPMAVTDPDNYRVNGEPPRRVLYTLRTQQATIIMGEPFDKNSEITLQVQGLVNAGIFAKPLTGDTTFTLQADMLATLPAPTNNEAESPVVNDIVVSVDPYRDTHPISPYIYGMANTSPDYADALNIGMARWGGNANSRYNWKLGNAWNASRDWQYRNTDFGLEGNVADTTFIENDAIGLPTLLTIPTLGWVAKDTESCAFPLPNGDCGTAGEATCSNPKTIVDPTVTSIESPPSFMVEWVEHLQTLGVDLPFFVMGDEPGLWGVTHYDVHPECTSYEEIYGQFSAYASPIKQIAPDTQLAGPASCCWWFYWNTMASNSHERVSGGEEFLPWFLMQAAQHEADTGERILDILDVHYYPANVYNDDTSPETAAMRLRSTRSLWDFEYVDESWIDEAIFLIPRLKQLIAEKYPGTKVGIGEWNFGADDTMNGALAIADVLGIYGREGVFYAAYWEHPELESPGYYAFKMFTNFDNAGNSFAPFSIYAQSSDTARVSSYAARDPESGELHLMLINKQPTTSLQVAVELTSFVPENAGIFYQYDQTHDTIQQGGVNVGENFEITLPPYSITLVVMSE